MLYEQGKIEERKFYHSEWPLTSLLEARKDGLVTDEGEAWKYRYTHKDGTGGKYDLLFRRAALEAPPAQEPQRCAECDCENGGPDCTWIKWDPQPDETAALRAKLAQMTMDLAEAEALEAQHGEVIQRLTGERDAILALTPDATPAPDAVQEAARVLLGDDVAMRTLVDFQLRHSATASVKTRSMRHVQMKAALRAIAGDRT